VRWNSSEFFEETLHEKFWNFRVRTQYFISQTGENRGILRANLEHFILFFNIVIKN
jgi:hypothetical protein